MIAAFLRLIAGMRIIPLALLGLLCACNTFDEGPVPVPRAEISPIEAGIVPLTLEQHRQLQE